MIRSKKKKITFSSKNLNNFLKNVIHFYCEQNVIFLNVNHFFFSRKRWKIILFFVKFRKSSVAWAKCFFPRKFQTFLYLSLKKSKFWSRFFTKNIFPTEAFLKNLQNIHFPHSYICFDKIYFEHVKKFGWGCVFFSTWKLHEIIPSYW